MGYWDNQRAGAIDSYNKYFNAEEQKKYKKYFDEDMKYHADHKGQKGTWGNIDKFDNRAYYSDYNKSKMDGIRKDYEERYQKDLKANANKPIEPTGPIESESTQQGAKPIESQSTAKGEKPSVKPVEPTPPPQSAVGVTVPSMQDHSSNADGNTPSANRKNKRRGKRGFMITREQGQGLNI